MTKSYQKIVLLGDSGVGKSSLCTKFVRGIFTEHREPTIGAAFLTATVNFEDKSHKLEIWDTAGQERYKSLAPMYYRGAVAAIIVYDITREDSFNGAKSWINELKTRGPPNIIIVLVANKYDLLDSGKREVNSDDYLNENSETIHFFKASSKTGYNINEIFEYVAKESFLLKNDESNILRNYKVDFIEKKKSHKCC